MKVLFFRLSPEEQSNATAVETRIKEKYMERIQSLMLTELKAFNKHRYKEMMIQEMKEALPTFSDIVINTQCHYISNALNNECMRLVSERRRPNAQRNQKHTKTDSTHRKIDIETLFELSESFNQLSIVE